MNVARRHSTVSPGYTPNLMPSRKKTQRMDSLRNVCSGTDLVTSRRTEFDRTLSTLFSGFAILIRPVRHKNSMCEYYGHVVDSKTWKNGLPRCSDCKKVIDSKEQLRRSELRKDDKEAQKKSKK